jgi:hypothetical protein
MQLTCPAVKRSSLACTLTVLLAFGVSMFAASRSEAGFVVRESGYWTCETGPSPCVYWLDDSRVIFNGAKPDDILLSQEGRRVWNHANYIWNLNTNAVSRYGDARRATLCYADGYVRYERQEGDEFVTYAGPIGREAAIRRRAKNEPVRQAEEEIGWNTQLSCGAYLPRSPYPLSGQKIGLKKGHGFLYLGDQTRDSKSKPVGYFRHGASTSLDLPIARWQLSPATVVPSRIDASYLLFGPQRSHQGAGWNLCPEVAVERTLYRLALDGNTSEITIPAHESFRCYVSRFELVRGGVLVFKGGGHTRNLDLSKLYFIDGDKIIEVVRGVITDHDVSPNGCRLAVAVSSAKDARRPSSAPIYRGHLKVVDFCRE